MRIKGAVNGSPLHILIDSGSTHNFLDLSLAKKLGCEWKNMEPQAVTVADGNHIMCPHQCKEFSSEMQGKQFLTDVMLIPLGSCDMVLGIQWLSTLGPICWDFKKFVMDFMLDNQKFKPIGIPAKKVKVVEGGPSVKLLEGVAHLCFKQSIEVN